MENIQGHFWLDGLADEFSEFIKLENAVVVCGWFTHLTHCEELPLGGTLPLLRQQWL